VAVPNPVLDTVMSKPIAVPAETGPAVLAVLRMWVGHVCGVQACVLLLPPSLPEETVAVLDTRAQSSLVVAEVTWIGPMLLLGARSEERRVGEEWRTGRVMAQQEKEGESEQLRAPPAGSG